MTGQELESVSHIGSATGATLRQLERRVQEPLRGHHPQMGSAEVVHSLQEVNVLHMSTE